MNGGNERFENSGAVFTFPSLVLFFLKTYIYCGILALSVEFNEIAVFRIA